jgi:hypothetical protein
MKTNKKRKGLKIYVAGPYTSESSKIREINVQKAVEIGCALMKKGHSPFVPHLYHSFTQHPDGKCFNWDRWMDVGRVFLETCDALYFIGTSKGADIELKTAKRMGKKIYYDIIDVDDLSILE